MTNRKQLLKIKTQTLKKIAEIGPMRRGSLTVHYQDQKNKDGSVTQLGPYTIYTFKRNDGVTIYTNRPWAYQGN